MNKQEMTEYINRVVQEWHVTFQDRYVLSVSYRREKFDAFQSKHYMTIDKLKNITDERGRFVFDLLDQKTKDQFTAMCLDIDTETHFLAPERARQTQAIIGDTIRGLDRHGHFASGKVPTVSEASHVFLRQYAGVSLV